MKTSPSALDLIIHFEGARSDPYTCPARKLTIGHGHVILANELSADQKILNCHNNSYNVGLTPENMREILVNDCLMFETWIPKLITTSITQNQFDALISFIFNLGPGSLQNSSLRKLINSDPNHPEISSEFAKWVIGGGKVLSGLVKRRAAEAKLYQGLPWKN